MSFFIAKRRAFDPSCCRAVACARQEWAQASDVFLPIDLRQKNYANTEIYGLLSLSHRYAMPAPPSGGAKERVRYPLPSSDEEGVSATCRADERRELR